jgi:hypothetical protein
MLEREHGPLTLTLEGGPALHISDKHLTFKLRGEGKERMSVYRLRILDQVPTHMRSDFREPAEQQLMDLVRKDEAARADAPR